MCTISINPASITAVPLGSGSNSPTQITVNGTVTNCTSNSVWVEVECAGQAPSRAQAVITGNAWTVTLQSKCPCGSQVTITAVCKDSPPCTDTLNTTLICTCCPTGNISYCVEYGPSGQALVKFENFVDVQSGCAPVTVQRDFGDGSPLGIIKTFPSGNNKYSEIHAYSLFGAGHTYISTLNILSPSSCSPAQTTVQISPPPTCSTSSLWAAICRILQFLFLLYGSSAIVLFISLLSGCTGFNTNLLALTVGFAGSAVLVLLLIWAVCRKCVCRFYLKLLGQLLMVTGVLLSMFIVQVACIQLTLGTLTPLTWIILITIALLYAGYLVLNRGWYGQGCCPVTICDFWQAIIFAMTVAFVAALLVFLVLPGGVQALGLMLALLLANAIMTYAGIQANINQSANNC